MMIGTICLDMMIEYDDWKDGRLQMKMRMEDLVS